MMKYKLSRTQSKWARWFALWLAGFLSVIVIVPWLFVHTLGESMNRPKRSAMKGARPQLKKRPRCGFPSTSAANK